MRALFFGRDNCSYSRQAEKHLVHLGFDIHSILSRTRGEPLPSELASWTGEYIFCFRSYFWLPKALIERATIAAINFHPGPPEYPGSGCANWAVYESSPTFGVTAHFMNERIDSGPIVECRRFPLLPQDTINTLLVRTHLKAYDLLLDTTTGLALKGPIFLESQLARFAHENWRANARKMREVDRLQMVDSSISKEELERIIRSTHMPEFPLETRIHGFRFFLRL